VHHSTVSRVIKKGTGKEEEKRKSNITKPVNFYYIFNGLFFFNLPGLYLSLEYRV
jgi:hypothetical protein